MLLSANWSARVTGDLVGPRGRHIGGRLMPGFAFFLLRAAWSAACLLMAGTSASLAQQRVGVNSAVNPEATGGSTRRGAAPAGDRPGRHLQRTHHHRRRRADPAAVPR